MKNSVIGFKANIDLIVQLKDYFKFQIVTDIQILDP